MGIIVFRHWWAIALRGALAILFGLVALFWPHLTLEALVICFGAFALVGGIFAVVVALGDRGAHARWGLLLAEGLVGIAIGVLTFFWPAVTALVLLSLIALWAIVTGVLEITVAVWMHRAVGNEWMLLLGGVASLLFGVLLAVLPGVGLLALTWLIGLYALLFGALLVVLGFQWRRLERLVAM
jgi:uncharacterized membrane protein HdeD (DUF308 family)